MNKKISMLTYYLLVVGIFFGLVFWFTRVYSQESRVPDSVYEDIEILELADTETERQKGLKGRVDLCKTCGMLFDFESERDVRMWMQDTPTSLDMIFMNKNGEVVNIHKNTEPYREFPTYDSVKKAKYVLEMKAGWVKNYNIKIGMKFDIELLKTLISI